MKKLNVIPDGRHTADEWWSAAYRRLFRGEAPALMERLDFAGDEGVWVSRDEWRRFLGWARRLRGWTDGSAFAVRVRAYR
jgi:hypothetical protein